ncbi:uncharacterized protein [Aegilops tauschii subsp. strangulata]|uniref:uncharacterized protein n=1 Tax=Aegilops tauschii subsp. strangulata TaxID=200361 RepID=UPI00098A0989|nr:uncharacterized protein LOC109745123 [Aegilops tauschii subsp. strangulata]
MSGRFNGLEFHHVKRDDNVVVDALAKMGAWPDPVPSNIFLEQLFNPSIKLQADQEPASEVGGSEPDHTEAEGSDPGIRKRRDRWLGAEITSSAHEVMAVIPAWTEPILAYLIQGELPEDKTVARHIVRRSAAYAEHNGELYKRSITCLPAMRLS